MKLPVDSKSRQTSGSSFFGAMLILGASLMFSATNLGIRLGKPYFTADNFVLYRSVIQVLILTPFTLKIIRAFEMKQFRFHFFRGVFGIASMIATYSAVQRLPLALATALAMTGVVWAGVFSRVFLKESQTQKQVVFSLGSFIGLFIVVWPTHNHRFDYDSLGITLGLLGGISMGAAHTLLRKLRVARITTIEIVFYFGICGIIMTLPGFCHHPQFPTTLHHWKFLAVVGVIGSIGQMLMTQGFSRIPTAQGSLVLNSQTPINIALGMLVLGEFPPETFYVGLILMLAGITGVVWSEGRG